VLIVQSKRHRQAVPEAFEPVDFSRYEVTGRAPCLGETRVRIGDATRKSLDRPIVEASMGRRGVTSGAAISG